MVHVLLESMKRSPSTLDYSDSITSRTTSTTTEETYSDESSLEDVAEIDMELSLTMLSQENTRETHPVLFSKATLNESVAFRSLSPRKTRR